MEMNLHNITDNQFTSYTKESVTVNKKEYKSNIIVTNNGVFDFNIAKIEDIKLEDLSVVFDFNPDLVIFGTGDKVIYPNMKIFQIFYNKSIGVEVMSIHALCRTYNFLVSEGRKIACILFLKS
ncbi:MAG: Mth938-like domain-containing protein [Neisseriaceae bacterium]